MLLAILLAATAIPGVGEGGPSAEPGLGREQAARLARESIRDMIPLRVGIDSLVLIGIRSGKPWRIDFEQTYRNVIVDGPPVEGISGGRNLGLSVQLSRAGELARVEDHFCPDLQCDSRPLVGEEEAIRIANESVPEEQPWNRDSDVVVRTLPPPLTAYRVPLWARLRVLPPGPGRLVWEVQVGHYRIDVDARDGSVVSRRVTISCLSGR